MGLKLKDDTPYEAVGPIKCSKKLLKVLKKLKEVREVHFSKKCLAILFWDVS